MTCHARREHFAENCNNFSASSTLRYNPGEATDKIYYFLVISIQWIYRWILKGRRIIVHGLVARYGPRNSYRRLNLTRHTVYSGAKCGGVVAVGGHVKRELLLRNTRGTADGPKLCFDYSCLPSELLGGKQPQVGGIVWLSRLRTSRPILFSTWSTPLLHLQPLSTFSYFVVDSFFFCSAVPFGARLLILRSV